MHGGQAQGSKMFSRKKRNYEKRDANQAKRNHAQRSPLNNN